MSSDTLAKAPAAPDIPEHADSPRIVPRRRTGQWTAAVAVIGPTLHEAAWLRIVPPQAMRSIPLLSHTVVTSVLGVGRHCVEQHYARGAELTR